MHSCCETTPVERAQPWLGTRVAIRIDAWEPGAPVHEAMSAAFHEIARIHRLMSFHEASSDVSRLNRDAWAGPVPVDASTQEVIDAALALSRQSDGVFDIALGGRWVAAGLLPSPVGGCEPEPSASYADIEINDAGIRFHRPLWIDLGGIAKGYAADRAIAVLRHHGVHQACVDAGGDLATLGEGPHRVALDDGLTHREQLAVIEIGEGAVATSCNRASVLQRTEVHAISHWDGHVRQPIHPPRAATVVADKAMHADALTKVVMALGPRSGALLGHYGASAYLHTNEHGWEPIGRV